MEKKSKNKVVKMDKKLVEILTDYLSTRLNYHLSFKETDQTENAIHLCSQNIEANKSNAGLFHHIIQTFRIRIIAWKGDPKEGSLLFFCKISIYYTHTGSAGSNGHDLNIELNVYNHPNEGQYTLAEV